MREGLEIHQQCAALSLVKKPETSPGFLKLPHNTGDLVGNVAAGLLAPSIHVETTSSGGRCPIHPLRGPNNHGEPFQVA